MEQKTRLLVLTDISSPIGGYAEPDDTQSLIRLLLYANAFDLEGFVATYTKHNGGGVFPEYIDMMIQAYGKAQPWLLRHDARYPSKKVLLGLVRSGNSQDGPEHVGEGKDTEGSEWLIACADKEDDRPLWIAVWGGTTDLAQALWKVRHTRGEAGCRQFKSKLRVHAICDQYALGAFVREENPDLFYIMSKDACRGMYRDGDESLSSGAWLDTHIRSFHGTLGAAYPMYDGGDPWGKVEGMKEGDTPSFLYLIPNGLGDPEHPEWGSWGGRFEKAAGSSCYLDAEDSYEGSRSARATVFRWREAYQRDFQARMDWCVADYDSCNHAPVARIDSPKTIAAAPGSAVRLDASASSDPDGDELDFEWRIYKEAGTCSGEAVIRNSHASKAEVDIPLDSEGCSIHIILSVTDRGEPPLTSYGRVVVEIGE
ncbi:nucleoside hydrolase-like domain-containing protein [Paenibacillus sp. HB172176]|uniref:nucleoside hydrolase-like domain-containing protein n=1 Tax=Paenibacillus sp. HB172176 TaxID=2493690 RepID=UPI001438E751|nr:nucleoside hydrolase-like domain-containing protein [Paenibacillus sp. HB172176]